MARVRKRIGLIGLQPQKWASVNKTLNFYQKSLSTKYHLRYLDPNLSEIEKTPLDAAITMSSPKLWEISSHPSFPILYVMNGGAVLDQEFLYSHLGNLESSDTLIVNCTSDINILEKMFKQITPRIINLPLPVNTETYKPLNKRWCRSRLPIKEADYFLGFVGRLLPQKNLHGFLRFLSEIKRLIFPKSIVGIITGKFWVDYPVLPYVTEEYPGNIQKLIEELDLKNDVFYFPGPLSENELAIFYNCMDILIHPTFSLDENFGYVPVEAMACGIPVVASAYGGLKDTIAQGKTGFLMPTWVTPSGIRMDISFGIRSTVRLLEDTKLYAHLSKNAIRRVQEKYTFEVCGDMLCDAIEKSINEKGSKLSQSVKVRKQKAYPKIPGFLPKVQKPWEHYINVVSKYVSTSVPSVDSSLCIRIAGPLVKKNGKYKLLDDAWPAEYKFDSEIEYIISKCREEIPISTLLKDKLISSAKIKNMIDCGLLLASA